MSTSSVDSDTHEDRRVGDVYLCGHCTAGWYSRYWYLTAIHSVPSCNLSMLTVQLQMPIL